MNVGFDEKLVSVARRQSDESAIDHFLHLLVVARTLHGHLSQQIADLTKIVCAQFNIGPAKVLSQAMQLGGARNWRNPRLLRKQPSQRNPGGSRLLALGDLADQLDQVVVGMPSLVGETRQRVADIAFPERRAVVDLAGQLTPCRAD